MIRGVRKTSARTVAVRVSPVKTRRIAPETVRVRIPRVWLEIGERPMREEDSAMGEREGLRERSGRFI